MFLVVSDKSFLVLFMLLFMLLVLACQLTSNRHDLHVKPQNLANGMLTCLQPNGKQSFQFGGTTEVNSNFSLSHRRFLSGHALPPLPVKGFWAFMHFLNLSYFIYLIFSFLITTGSYGFFSRNVGISFPLTENLTSLQLTLIDRQQHSEGFMFTSTHLKNSCMKITSCSIYNFISGLRVES